jgi:nitroimidazol reductase NimA-like FMN-containing flavoprotein (pyridoxamine 5'-phosphate oxidase superfamily)
VRRAELSCHDPELFAELSKICGESYLSLVTACGFPRALAVNFAARDETVYFHGARSGEKFERMTADSRVGFTMVQVLSLLPSHWFSPDNACPATQLFRSVEIKGHAHVVTDPAEKAAALQLLMEKYQPEGGYRPLAADEAMYTSALTGVGVFRIDPQSWTGKVKLLQKLTPDKRQGIVDRLTERGEVVDLLTVELMGRYAG